MRGWLVVVCLCLCSACGGGPRSTTADLLAYQQPTPDPTVDAIVRDLPRALAGVPPTATPTLAVIPTPRPAAKAPTPVPTQKPRLPTPTPHR